ncbi:MAG: NTP transferase domain-containing protein, partial [Methanobacterium paludis]|nr:NTP transferase domain-containing protein [Methanobacterium paludis]
MVYAVIMAGGMGIRFWPKSRKDTPKQFLSTVGDTTMIQATIERIKDIIPIDNICVVTNKNYVNKIKMLIPELPVANIFVEPMNKETAACIGLATINIYKRDKDAIIIALPADHIIGEKEIFIKILVRATKVVKYNDIIATIGITPNRPETGYGYIEKSKLLDSKEGINVYSVSRFVEKPNREKAIYMLKDGKYFWNSGMFIFR